MAFLIPLTCVTLCQFYFITSDVLFTKNNKRMGMREKGMREKKIFLYMAPSAYHYISKDVESCVSCVNRENRVNHVNCANII